MFQFKNTKENKTFTLNEIDKIACEFWGVEYDTRHYASPNPSVWGMPNWFDTIGHAIEDLQYFAGSRENKKVFYRSINSNVAEFDFGEIATMLLQNNTRCCKNPIELEEMIDFLKPYTNLCYYLKSLEIIGIGMGW